MVLVLALGACGSPSEVVEQTEHERQIEAEMDYRGGLTFCEAHREVPYCK